MQSDPFVFRHRLKSTLLTAGVCAATLIAATSLSAATITFQTPTTFSTTSVLDAPLTLSGYSGVTLVDARNFGDSAQSVTTTGAQTIHFADTPADGDHGPSGTVSGVFYGWGEKNPALFAGSTGSAGFDAVLQSQAWGPSQRLGNRQTVRIGSLTIGQTYIVQLLFSDMRTGNEGRTQFLADATSGGNRSAEFSTATATSVVATFTADAVSQDVFIFPGSSSPFDSTVAGFTLYSATAIPAAEPAPASISTCASTSTCAVAAMPVAVDQAPLPLIRHHHN